MWGGSAKELLESRDELAGGRRLAARETSVACQDQSSMVVATRHALVVDRDEVSLVVGDERPFFADRPVKERFVGGSSQVGALCDGDDVSIALAQLLGDCRGVHLVQQQLQTSAARSRRQADSAASASASLRAIHSSISAG